MLIAQKRIETSSFRLNRLVLRFGPPPLKVFAPDCSFTCEFLTSSRDTSSSDADATNPLATLLPHTDLISSPLPHSLTPYPSHRTEPYPNQIPPLLHSHHIPLLNSLISLPTLFFVRKGEGGKTGGGGGGCGGGGREGLGEKSGEVG